MTYLNNTPFDRGGGNAFETARGGPFSAAPPRLQAWLEWMWLWLQGFGEGAFSPFSAAGTPSIDLETLILDEQQERALALLGYTIDATAPHLNMRARGLSMVTATYGFTKVFEEPRPDISNDDIAAIKAALQAEMRAHMTALRRKYVKWRNSRVWLWANDHGIMRVPLMGAMLWESARYAVRPFAALIPD